MTTPTTPNAISVEIMGVTYHVRSDASSDYLQDLAEVVNAKTREIREQTATVDSLKCAVLTALNLADDLCKLNTEYRSYRQYVEKQQNRIIKTIDSATQPGG